MGRGAILFSVFVSVLLAVFTYQQCTPVRLAQKNELTAPSTLEGEIRTQVPPPKLKMGPVRVVFFVDQSVSMILGKCDGDVDSAAPAPDGLVTNCRTAEAIDLQAHRYAAIGKWIQELETYGTDNLDEIKIMIAPFSGGWKTRPTAEDLADPKRFKFVSIADAKLWLAEVKSEHVADRALLHPSFGGNPTATPLSMGTTVPLTTLQHVEGKIRTEMQNLKTANKLETTPFHFIYLSDGVFKPLEEYVKKCQLAVGCPDCAVTPSDIGCDPSPPGTWSGLTPWQFCFQHLPTKFREAFGNPSLNTLDQIVAAIIRIKDLPRTFQGATINVHLVRVHPELLNPDDKNKPSEVLGHRNIFDEIYSQIPGTTKWSLTSENPPFSLVTKGGSQLTYRLENFIAINLNAFVGAGNRIQTDSDGDGVSDDEERSRETNPTDPKTNGICNDQIYRDWGCRVFNCEKRYDQDGDGLNSCEEGTVPSNSKSYDFDHDLVPDSYEVLRGINPNADDRGEAAIDGKTMHDHFYSAVLPTARISEARYADIVDVSIKEFGYAPIGDTLGNISNTGVYNIKIANMPLVNTLAVTKFYELYSDQNLTKAILTSDRIIATAHDAGVNQLVFLAKIVANENPNVTYWLMKREQIPYGRSGGHTSLTLRFEDFKQVSIFKDGIQ